MVKDEIEAVLNLADTLEQARHRPAPRARRRSPGASRPRAPGSTTPNKPIGVFMLAGPSGVGKTETALALAEALYGGEQNIITINMSEFQEAHTVSTLKGAPPGYVGYGEGGVLTEAVRRRPYSVVLLDEVEKAHPDVHEIFFQVFDKGRMEDSTGRCIDFNNTDHPPDHQRRHRPDHEHVRGPRTLPLPQALAEAVRKPILEYSDDKLGSPKFTPAFLGRVHLVPYYTLSDEVLRKIVELQLGRVKKRLAENRGIAVTFDPSVGDLIASRCTEVQSGARVVEGILTQTLLPELSRELLEKIADGIMCREGRRDRLPTTALSTISSENEKPWLRSQQDRRLKLTTPLGEDVLLITGFTGDEELSRSFSYDLELASTDGNIAFNDIIGQNVTVKVEAEMVGTRFFNGFVSEFIQIEDDEQLARYRAKVVPWLWFLTRTSDCRIFQEKTIRRSSRRSSIRAISTSMSCASPATIQPLEYCVQYRETDFNFVSRLMEQEGICYFFMHEDGSTSWCWPIRTSAHEPCPDMRDGHLFSVRTAATILPASARGPAKSACAQGPSPTRTSISRLPARSSSRTPAIRSRTITPTTRSTTTPAITWNARRATTTRPSGSRSCSPGTRCSRGGGYRRAPRWVTISRSRKPLAMKTTGSISSPGFTTRFTRTPFGSRVVSGLRFYQCRLWTIPASVEFRPLRETPKPLVSGPQTAIVAGPAGEEIYTRQAWAGEGSVPLGPPGKSDDKQLLLDPRVAALGRQALGRHRDPRASARKSSSSSSRAIPTSRSSPAGSTTPSRPPPYDLPPNKTQSGVKSRSSLGGGPANFNEIRLRTRRARSSSISTPRRTRTTRSRTTRPPGRPRPDRECRS